MNLEIFEACRSAALRLGFQEPIDLSDSTSIFSNTRTVLPLLTFRIEVQQVPCEMSIRIMEINPFHYTVNAVFRGVGRPGKPEVKSIPINLNEFTNKTTGIVRVMSVQQRILNHIFCPFLHIPCLTLTNLPPVLITQILQFLFTAKEYFNLSATCRIIRELCSTEHSWIQFISSDFAMCWKQAFCDLNLLARQCMLQSNQHYHPKALYSALLLRRRKAEEEIASDRRRLEATRTKFAFHPFNGSRGYTIRANLSEQLRQNWDPTVRYARNIRSESASSYMGLEDRDSPLHMPWVHPNAGRGADMNTYNY